LTNLYYCRIRRYENPRTDNDGQVIIFKDEGTHLDEALSLFDEYHKRNDQFFYSIEIIDTKTADPRHIT
jgi:hypothetical protein